MPDDDKAPGMPAPPEKRAFVGAWQVPSLEGLSEEEFDRLCAELAEEVAEALRHVEAGHRRRAHS
jgi:hypothetical protein